MDITQLRDKILVSWRKLSNHPTLEAKYSLDTLGNYILSEPAHEFSPSFLSAFLGDGIDYLSNFNFLDISSFDVSGNVYYLDPSKSDSQNCTDIDGNPLILTNSVYIGNCNTSLPTTDGNTYSNIGVEGALILVDKEPVYDQNGNQVATSADGSFSLRVPIGMHEISVQKNGHTFVRSVWNTPSHSIINVNENTPQADTRAVYNFIENKQGLTFYDNTKRRLVGRVCGGTTEANKPYFDTSNPSINNIGQAIFTLKNVGTEIHSVQITTDVITGEYSVDLLPISYEVKYDANAGRLFDVPSHVISGFNSVNYYFLNDHGNGQPYPFSPIDLLNEGASSLPYDWAENFVFRVIPSISYYTSMFDHDNNSSTDEIAIVGESNYSIKDNSYNQTTQQFETVDNVIPLIKADGLPQLGIPIFKKGVSYIINTSVHEVYKNCGTNDTIIYNDTVSLGTLSLNDGISTNSITMASNKTSVPFKAMEVNTSLNGEDSFQKNFTLSYSDGSLNVDKNQDYYLFGSAVNEG